WRRPPFVETLEDRTLPTVSVPVSLDPGTGLQTLFATDLSQQVLVPALAQQQLLRFALDTQAPAQAVTFRLAPVATFSNPDAATGLYDGDGTQLAVADNPNGPPSNEELTATLSGGQVYVVGVFFAAPTQDPFTLTVAPGMQTVNASIAVDA